MNLTSSEREALKRLADRAAEVAEWAEPDDPRERGRLESALEELAEMLTQE